MALEETLATTVVEIKPDETRLVEWPDHFSEEEIDHGDPNSHRGAVLYRDPTKRLSYGIWECPPCKFELDYGPMSEMGTCIEGRATVTDVATGASVELTPGKTMIIPVGTTVIWEVHDHFKKVYVGFEDEWDEERFY